MIDHVCPVCQNPFRGKAERKFCSSTCSGQSRLAGQQKVCPVCNKPFYAGKQRTRAQFCSRACADVHQGRNKATYCCTMCGNEVRVPRSTKARKYCSLACRDADPDVQRQRIELNLQQQRGQTTKPERTGYALLDSLGVPYERQHLIAGKFCVDAFVPSAGLVVQFDGDYWHGNPARFPTLDERQAKRARLDRSQDAYMGKLGYHVARLWESELARNLPGCRARLEALLGATSRGPLEVSEAHAVVPHRL